MSKVLESHLLEAEGKKKEEIPLTNPFRDIGFDKDKNRLGWVRVLPFQKIKEALESASDALSGKDNFIFTGMGGSINGIKALLSLFKNHSIYTLDNLDPSAIKNLTAKIKDFRNTLVIPISKSGTTKETQFLAVTLKELFSSAFGKASDVSIEWEKHFLWLADPGSFEKLGSLGWQGVKKLPIQFDARDDIGGRFSCPNTLIFALPLFLLLNKDFKRIEEIYNSYFSLQEKIREKAYYFYEKYKDRSGAYFYPVVKGVNKEGFSCWLVQLFGESLGSKKKDLAVKILLSQRNGFLPLSLGLKIEEPVVNLMCQMYFFQIFTAFYSSFKTINFVSQDFVEEYKNQMRKIEDEKKEDASAMSLGQIIERVKEQVSKSPYQFIDIVLYFYPNKKVINLINKKFSEEFTDKQISVFIGSDWNHHSYQAAFGDKNTFYVLLLSSAYKSKLKFISSETVRKNIEAVELISRATYLTLSDKSILTKIDLTVG